MKATKIVGAVLGVLMVAALFSGAVVALADNEESLGDVYINKLYTALGSVSLVDNATGWTNVATGATISFILEEGSTTEYYIQDNAISAATTKLAGTYQKVIGNKNYLIDVKYPTATISGTVYNNGTADHVAIGNLIGGIANTGNNITVSIPATIANTAATPGYVAGIGFTLPEKKLTQVMGTVNGSNIEFSTNLSEYDLGVWTLTPVFYKGNGSNGFSKLAPDFMYGEPVHFTLISKDTTKKLASAVDNVTQGGYVTVIISAPYGDWYVGVDKEAVIPMNQPGITGIWNKSKGTPLAGEDYIQAKVHVDTSNTATFVVKSVTSNNLKVMLYEDNDNKTVLKEITINVKAGAITAKAEKDSVYIGDEFDVSGTNDLGGNVKFFLKGTNYPLTFYGNTSNPDEAYDVGSGKIWTATIDTSKLVNPDAGVYTIYVAKVHEGFTGYNATYKTEDFDNESQFDAYTTLSVSLIQPFITANVKNGVVVQSDKLEVYGSAEGNPVNVQLYVFGTNFFKTTNTSVLDDGTYTFSQKIVGTDKVETDAWSMAAGQYFLVVQHPMYDDTFNIAPVPAEGLSEEAADNAGNFNIMLNESASAFDGANATIIFNTLKRQSANAAQALIDAIGSQNIDDMQAHLSFIVAGPTSYVNAIPSQVTKGQALTISGTTTGHKNEVVAVELLSTAFAAVPKETVGSAAFATLTTRIGDDGVWSVSFDTSNLNADDYTVSVAVGQLDPVAGKTKIVDGSTPSVNPTTNPTGAVPTVNPTTKPTTTPATPGFGALAALVGLGAVAVLLLRRE